MKNNIDAINTYIGDYHLYIEKLKQVKQSIYQPFLTISRQAGAGGITISREICKILNEEHKGTFPCTWANFDKELINVVIDKFHLPGEFKTYLEENTRPQLKDLIQEILGMHPSSVQLVKDTNQTILQLAQMGYAILVGRGANLLTRKMEGGLHVRLVASKTNRIAHLEKYLRTNESDAEKFMEREDEGRRNYLSEYFCSKDIDDPLLYDITINTDHLTYREAAEIISQEILKRYQRKHSTQQKHRSAV